MLPVVRRAWNLLRRATVMSNKLPAHQRVFCCPEKGNRKPCRPSMASVGKSGVRIHGRLADWGYWISLTGGTCIISSMPAAIAGFHCRIVDSFHSFAAPCPRRSGRGTIPLAMARTIEFSLRSMTAAIWWVRQMVLPDRQAFSVTSLTPVQYSNEHYGSNAKSFFALILDKGVSIKLT